MPTSFWLFIRGLKKIGIISRIYFKVFKKPFLITVFFLESTLCHKFQVPESKCLGSVADSIRLIHNRNFVCNSSTLSCRCVFRTQLNFFCQNFHHRYSTGLKIPLRSAIMHFKSLQHQSSRYLLIFYKLFL